jgi:hypothetical protein
MRFTHKSLVGKLTAGLTGALMLSVIGLNLAWSQTQRGSAPSVPFAASLPYLVLQSTGHSRAGA